VCSITVGTVPTTVAVPDVTGQSRAEATRVLSGKGFEVRQRERSTKDADEDGEVLAQSPAGGQAKRGATVTITVGAFDDSQIVPDDPAGGGGGSGGTTGPTGP